MLFRSLITSESTSCFYQNEGLVCNGETYSPSEEYNIYGFTTFFLDSNDSTSEIGIMPDQSMVFSNKSLTFYQGNQVLSTIDISTIIETDGFNGAVIFVGKILLVMSLILSFLGNMLMLLVVALISTIPFFRLKRFIPYRKIYKLVIFAISPFAVLMTFYNLINFDQWIFFILMLVAYRSVFQLQRELYFQTYSHLGTFENPQQNNHEPTNPDDVTDETEIIVRDDETNDEDKEE